MSESVCLIRQEGDNVQYQKVSAEGQSINCPCTNQECSIELLNCPTEPIEIKEPFKVLTAHCQKLTKRRKIEVTQEFINMLNISNTHLVLPKKSEVKKIVSSGTSVLHATFSNITTIQTQPLANFTISKCELEEEHCGINIQDFKLNKIDTVTIGDGNKVTSNNFHLVAGENTIIRFGQLGSLSSMKGKIEGSASIFAESAITNSLQGIFDFKTLSIDRPIEIEYLDEIQNGSCVKILSAKNLESIPERMEFDLYKGALDFFEFDVKKGELKFDEEKKRYEVKGECKVKKEGNETKCEEYIEVDLANKTKLILPTELLEHDRVVDRVNKMTKETKRVYMIGEGSKDHFHFRVEEGEKFGLKKVKKGTGNRIRYVYEFELSKNAIKKHAITSQLLAEESDIEFAISEEESLIIPSGSMKHKLPFENYDIYVMDDNEFLIFNSKTRLNIPTFYTSGNYNIVRKKNSVSLC